MVVCYGSTARPIHQAASWLPEVMHARGPTVSPKNCIFATKHARCIFPCSAHWSSVRGLPVVPPFLLDTNMCCCTCCTCQRKLGVRLTLGLPPSRTPLASASAAVALIDGGSPSGSLGFCAPSRLRCLGGGSPTGSLGFCARCPALALLSEGLPAGPHGHCASLASSCSWSAGVSAVGSTSLSSSPPQSGGVTSGELASLFTLGSEVSSVVPFFAEGLSVRRRAPS